VSRKRGNGRLVAALALVAVLVFVAGEGILFFRSEGGSFFLAENGLPFSRPRVTASLSQTVQAALRRLGVPASTQTAQAVDDDKLGPLVRWEVRLPPRASLFLVNASLTDAVESKGGRVFDAWEEAEARGAERVTLTLGIGKTVTHQVVLERRGGEDVQESVRLAIVVEGFAEEGADSLAQVALRLPFPFSGAVLANGDRTRGWADALAQGEREPLAQLPMEPLNYPKRSPGRDAILVDMTRDQIKRLVKKHLHAVPGAVAGLPYMGAMALQDANAMAAVAGELKGAKLAYVEEAGEMRSVGLDAAASAGVPFLRLDGRFDPGHGPAAGVERAARDQLRGFADTARRRGWASFIVRLDATALAALAREVPKLESQGVRVVPLSSLLRPSAY
jgi:polysaccharide deacetylase 2 family uncharacterized protein YibQ